VKTGELASDLLKSVFPAELKKLSDDLICHSERDRPFSVDEKVEIFVNKLIEREQIRFRKIQRQFSLPIYTRFECILLSHDF
jgi:hypothetical protein